MPGKLVFGMHIESIKILVILNPTGYMFTSSGFDAFISFEVYSIDSSKMIDHSPEGLELQPVIS